MDYDASARNEITKFWVLAEAVISFAVTLNTIVVVAGVLASVAAEIEVGGVPTISTLK